MDATSSGAMWIVILAALFCTTDGDVIFCGSGNQMEEQQYDTDLLGDGSRDYSSSLDKCACTVTANGTVYLESTVEFRTDPDVQQTNDTCGPLLKFQYDKVRSYVCPTEGIESNKNDTILYHHLEHGKSVSVEVINSAKTRIKAIISFEVKAFQGSFSLECETIQTSSRTGICPCNPYVTSEPIFEPATDVPIGTRVAIAFTCVIIFLVIFGGLFLLWWKKLRHRDDDYKDGPDGKPQQPVPVAPPSLTHDKGHINPQFTDIGRDGRKINVDGDPELNLALQTPTNSMGSKGLRGSTDSGLYSQGNGQYYANVPGDHADGLPPDMLYTPGLNLSGHADLQGPAPRSNKPVDVDALYAKPHKGGHHHRPKSGSQDQLNVPPSHGQYPQGQGQQHHPHGHGYGGHHPEWAVNESYVSDSSHNASQGSLNTSQPVVETDV